MVGIKFYPRPGGLDPPPHPKLQYLMPFNKTQEVSVAVHHSRLACGKNKFVYFEQKSYGEDWNRSKFKFEGYFHGAKSTQIWDFVITSNTFFPRSVIKRASGVLAYQGRQRKYGRISTGFSFTLISADWLFEGCFSFGKCQI